MKARDYKKEYRDYHSKPEQKKNRAKRMLHGVRWLRNMANRRYLVRTLTTKNH